MENKARKTCPDCRVVVKDVPAPAYLVSEHASTACAAS